ncbi:MAG: hypothetical protein J0H99_18550 [Rhodospirillales bacterium]|nr:hypothetical protein [Rhodospirillales bacterium]
MAHAIASRWGAGRAVGVFMAAYFAANAVNAFMPLWFADRGLSPAAIGQVCCACWPGRHGARSPTVSAAAARC